MRLLASTSLTLAHPCSSRGSFSLSAPCRRRYESALDMNMSLFSGGTADMLVLEGFSLNAFGAHDGLSCARMMERKGKKLRLRSVDGKSWDELRM